MQASSLQMSAEWMVTSWPGVFLPALSSRAASAGRREWWSREGEERVGSVRTGSQGKGVVRALSLAAALTLQQCLLPSNEGHMCTPEQCLLRTGKCAGGREGVKKTKIRTGTGRGPLMVSKVPWLSMSCHPVSHSPQLLLTFATALPMPEEPPVMTTSLFLRFIDFGLPSHERKAMTARPMATPMRAHCQGSSSALAILRVDGPLLQKAGWFVERSTGQRGQVKKRGLHHLAPSKFHCNQLYLIYSLYPFRITPMDIMRTSARG